MNISTTTNPPEHKLAKHVTVTDVLALAAQLVSEGWTKLKREALSWAWQCYYDWKRAKERAEAEERARYFRNFRRRKKAKIWGGVTVREGGAMSKGLSYECYSAQEIKEEQQKRAMQRAGIAA